MRGDSFVDKFSIFLTKSRSKGIEIRIVYTRMHVLGRGA